MKNGGYGSHNPRTGLKGHCQAETKDPELERTTVRYKSEISAGLLMNRNLQNDRNHPVLGLNRLKERMRRLHAELGEAQETIEAREIYYHPPRARSLENEYPAVISWSLRSQLDGTLLQESCDLRSKSLTLDGGGGVAREVNWNRGEQRTGEERDTVALPEDLNNPILCTPLAPGVLKWGKAASNRVGRGKRLLLLKILLLQRAWHCFRASTSVISHKKIIEKDTYKCPKAMPCQRGLRRRRRSRVN